MMKLGLTLKIGSKLETNTEIRTAMFIITIKCVITLCNIYVRYLYILISAYKNRTMIFISSMIENSRLKGNASNENQSLLNIHTGRDSTMSTFKLSFD